MKNKKACSEKRTENLEIIVPFSELLPVDPNSLINYKDRYFNECDDVSKIFQLTLLQKWISIMP